MRKVLTVLVVVALVVIGWLAVRNGWLDDLAPASAPAAPPAAAKPAQPGGH